MDGIPATNSTTTQLLTKTLTVTEWLAQASAYERNNNFVAALKIYLTLADSGNEKALTALCFMLQKINGNEQHEHQDFLARTFEHCYVLSENGSAAGAYIVGFMYQNGINVEKNLFYAIANYEKARDRGLLAAVDSLGLIFQQKSTIQNLTKACEFYDNASLHSPNAANHLAAMYEQGFGVKRNRQMADLLYKQADKLAQEAEEQNATIMISIETDSVVPQTSNTVSFSSPDDNGELDFELVKNTPNNNNHETELNRLILLAEQYKKVGDYEKAADIHINLLDKYKDAPIHSLGSIFERGETENFEYYKNTFDYCQERANKGSPGAALLVTLIYLTEGKRQISRANDAENTSEWQEAMKKANEYFKPALEYCEKSRAGESIQAINLLGVIYENSYGVAKDYKKAYSLYAEAASKGSREGLCNIGTMHRKGHEFQKSHTEARKYYIRAYKMGNFQPAAKLLANSYEEFGPRRDRTQAAIWRHRANSEQDGGIVTGSQNESINVIGFNEL